MDGWWSDTEESLQIGLCWRPSVDQQIRSNEGQVLALQSCEGLGSDNSVDTALGKALNCLVCQLIHSEDVHSRARGLWGTAVRFPGETSVEHCRSPARRASTTAREASTPPRLVWCIALLCSPVVWPTLVVSSPSCFLGRGCFRGWTFTGSASSCSSLVRRYGSHLISRPSSSMNRSPWVTLKAPASATPRKEPPRSAARSKPCPMPASPRLTRANEASPAPIANQIALSESVSPHEPGSGPPSRRGRSVMTRTSRAPKGLHNTRDQLQRPPSTTAPMSGRRRGHTSRPLSVASRCSTGRCFGLPLIP